MLPVIALVGRPNVGKSTLFNVLTRSRDALVADRPGLTRDRKYGYGRLGPGPYIVVDTGGIGESLAAIIQEEAFEDLDGPVRVVGALDAPVPYSPALEDEFLPGEQRIEQAARLLAGY